MRALIARAVLLVCALTLATFFVQSDVHAMPGVLRDLPGVTASFNGVSYGVALSENGYVIGELSTPAPDTFLWRDGVTTPLPFEEAWGVNARGHVVGYTPDGRGALWQAETIIPMNPPGDSRFHLPVEVNNRGQIVGIMENAAPNGPFIAFVWENGAVRELGPCTAYWGGGLGNDPNSYLHINERGDVIGATTETFNNNEPIVLGASFFWRNGVRSELPFFARALNDRGQVVGGSYLWENGEFTDLGSLGGGLTLAQAINNAGQVAGTSSTPNGEVHVFFWDHGRMQDLGGSNHPNLNTFQWLHVRDMNERGQIVGEDNNFALLWETGRTGPSEIARIATVSSGPYFGKHVSINNSGRIMFNGFAVGITALVWDRGHITPVELPPAPAPLRVTRSPVEPPNEPDAVQTKPGSFAARRVVLELLGTHPISGPADLRFGLPQAGRMTLRVYDARGREIRELESGWRTAGPRTVVWDGADEKGRQVPRGTYFCRLASEQGAQSLKLTRVR